MMLSSLGKKRLLVGLLDDLDYVRPGRDGLWTSSAPRHHSGTIPARRISSAFSARSFLIRSTNAVEPSGKGSNPKSSIGFCATGRTTARRTP